jgi:hypothetical protein
MWCPWGRAPTGHGMGRQSIAPWGLRVGMSEPTLLQRTELLPTLRRQPGSASCRRCVAYQVLGSLDTVQWRMCLKMQLTSFIATDFVRYKN